MAAKLVFLGKLADLAGESERELAAPIGWLSLLEALEAELADSVSCAGVRVAVNGVVLADKATLVAEDGDEIALLPPVSGG
jgi:molybdopterin synthase sulfur carrier subunit